MSPARLRVGQGWDLHRLVTGRRLVLGGVEIPSDRGEEGHSDGDVLIHAIIDALLGASCLGDIGRLYPPGDERWRGISSGILLRDTSSRLRKAGFSVVNVDATVVLELPKIAPHVEAIRRELAKDIDIPVERISVKAKTKEGVDATGTREAIEAQAIVLIEAPET